MALELAVSSLPRDCLAVVALFGRGRQRESVTISVHYLVEIFCSLSARFEATTVGPESDSKQRRLRSKAAVAFGCLEGFKLKESAEI